MVELTKTSLMVAGFVVAMMLLVEYLNVLTRGRWQSRLAFSRWRQYVIASLLGATPGCLGAFAVVAMRTHGVLTLGAVVAAMIATTGDEAFLMLALIPRHALLLAGILVPLGFLAGVLVDTIARAHPGWRASQCAALEIHAGDECQCFPRGRLLEQWRQCSAARGILAVSLTIFAAAVVTGQLGPAEWNWIRATLTAVSAGALFVVSTVPDHFLETHLWAHVARQHAPRVFLWVLGALIAAHVLTRHLDVGRAIGQGKWLLLLGACLAGLLPQSGPHMVLVTLFAHGAIPFSVLLANSVVQDGHGMLPLLAHSRREFLGVKAVNFSAGALLGAALMATGY